MENIKRLRARCSLYRAQLTVRTHPAAPLLKSRSLIPLSQGASIPAEPVSIIRTRPFKVRFTALSARHSSPPPENPSRRVGREDKNGVPHLRSGDQRNDAEARTPPRENYQSGHHMYDDKGRGRRSTRPRAPLTTQNNSKQTWLQPLCSTRQYGSSSGNHSHARSSPTCKASWTRVLSCARISSSSSMLIQAHTIIRVEGRELQARRHSLGAKLKGRPTCGDLPDCPLPAAKCGTGLETKQKPGRSERERSTCGEERFLSPAEAPSRGCALLPQCTPTTSSMDMRLTPWSTSSDEGMQRDDH